MSTSSSDKTAKEKDKENEIHIYVTMPSYLAQWFVHRHGGKLPVKLIKNSIESKALCVYLSKCPVDAKPVLQDGTRVDIIIPCYREKPPKYYNYLTPKAEAAFVACVSNNFDVDMWKELHQFGRMVREQKELVIAWMEKHGIEENGVNPDTCWNAIVKRYQRLRKNYLQNERVERHRNRRRI